MGSRVTRSAAGAAIIIDIDTTGGGSIEERLADPEVAAALAGEADGAALDTAADAIAGDAPQAIAEGIVALAEEVADQADATAGEPPEAGTDPVLEPVRLNRHQSPSKAATAWIATELDRARITIDGVIVDDEGRHWQGVSVIPWPTALAILATVPEQHPMHAELVAGGDLYTRTPCPDCGETIRHKIDTFGDMRIQGKKGIREVKPTFDAKWKAHVCGQAELPLADAPVAGQTEAFPEPEPEPGRTKPIPFVTFEDVIKLVDRVEREELLADDDRIGIPPEEEIATWSPDDLGLAYEYLWSVVHNEPERPPVPGILLRERPVVATIDGEPVGCSHEGAGLPDCPVCHSRLVDEADEANTFLEALDAAESAQGTGDPDGDLLP